MDHLTGTAISHPSNPGHARKPTRTPRRRAILGAVVAAAALGGPLVLGASTGASATARPQTSVPSINGDVHLSIWSVDSDGPDFQAILSGAIGDYGPAVTVLPNGKVDPEHTSEMELELHHGTFRLYIDGIANKFRSQTAGEPSYSQTCSDYFSVTGSVPVVAGSGTGAYRGIRGSFSVGLTVYEDQKTPPCGRPFVAQLLLLTGSGIVSS